MDRPRLAGGPWLAWLSVALLGRLPGGLIRPPPVDIGRFRYRSGFVARRSAEDLPPFRAPKQAVRDTALSLNLRSRNLRLPAIHLFMRLLLGRPQPQAERRLTH